MVGRGMGLKEKKKLSPRPGIFGQENSFYFQLSYLQNKKSGLDYSKFPVKLNLYSGFSFKEAVYFSYVNGLVFLR